jgi:hypothetical protein
MGKNSLVGRIIQAGVVAGLQGFLAIEICTANEMSQINLQLPAMSTLTMPNVKPGRLPLLNMHSITWGPGPKRDEPFISYDLDSALSPLENMSFIFTIIPDRIGEGGPSKDRTQTQDIPARRFYLLRMVVLRPRLQEEPTPLVGTESLDIFQRYVAGTQQIVMALSGVIKASVTLKFHMMSAISMRNTLLVQLIPIDETKLRFIGDDVDPASPIVPEPGPIRQFSKAVPFVPRQNSGSSDVAHKIFPDDYIPAEKVDLGLVIRYAEEYINQLRLKNLSYLPRMLARRMGFIPLAWDDWHVESWLKGSGWTSQKLAQVLNNTSQNSPILPESLIEPLCIMLVNALPVSPKLLRDSGISLRESDVRFYKQRALNHCFKSPEDSFDLARSYHVLKISKHQGVIPPTGSGGVERINVNSNFTTSRQHNYDAYWTGSQEFSITALIEAISPIDLKGIFNLGGSYSVAEGDSHVRHEGITVSRGTDLEVSSLLLPFSLDRRRDCSTLFIHPDAPAWKAIEKGQVGLFVCNREVSETPIKAFERYFAIAPAEGTASGSDPFHPSSQIVNLVLRGVRDYDAFILGIRQFILPANNFRGTSWEILKSAKSRFLPPTIPGVLSFPIEIRGAKIDERRRLERDPTVKDTFWHRNREKIR